MEVHIMRQVVKHYNAWQKTTLPANVVAAFKRAGIVSKWYEKHQGLFVHVDERFATEVRHFQQMQDFLVKVPKKQKAAYKKLLTKKYTGTKAKKIVIK